MTLAELLKKLYGDSTDMFGLPRSSDSCKELEALVKDLPKGVKDIGFQRMTFTPKAVEFEEGERADVSVITTSSVDRDREILLPKGIDWGQFKKNPVVPFGHDYRALPVGRALWVKRCDGSVREGDGWKAKTRYSTRPAEWKGDWMADAVWHMVKEGDLPGKSIGFIPTEIAPIDEKDLKERPDWAKARLKFVKSIALEYSIAPVQSNPDALVIGVSKMRKKGIEVPDILLEGMGLILPDSAEFTFGEPSSGLEAAQKTMPPHIRESDFIKAVQSGLVDMLSKVDTQKLVDECVARHRGQV